MSQKSHVLSTIDGTERIAVVLDQPKACLSQNAFTASSLNGLPSVCQDNGFRPFGKRLFQKLSIGIVLRNRHVQNTGTAPNWMIVRRVVGNPQRR
jgi:hypothetical protein